MIEKYGELVALASSSLTEVVYACERVVITSDEDRPRVEPGFALVMQAESAADHLRRAIIYCDLQTELMAQLERYCDELTVSLDVERLATLTMELRHRLLDLLKNQFFFRLDMQDVPHYGKKELFGARVAAKFPKNIDDVEAAGNCLALQQSTACVFHLMRIMEAAVQRLGKLLGVKLDPKAETWFNICTRASTSATNRPSKTKAQAAKNAAIGAAVSHLQTVRLAWRNEVMHPKQSYTREEAHEVYNAVRIFMTDLAGLI